MGWIEIVVVVLVPFPFFLELLVLYKSSNKLLVISFKVYPIQKHQQRLSIINCTGSFQSTVSKRISTAWTKA